jgi:hypothetical protein
MHLRVLLAALIAAFVMAGTVPVLAPSPAAAATKEKTTKKKEPTEKQKAARQRMKDCGAEWRAMKKAGKAKGTTWRKFSKECLAAKKK